MDGIPEIVEQLYYNWVTIPEPENGPATLEKIPCWHRGSIPSIRACALA